MVQFKWFIAVGLLASFRAGLSYDLDSFEERPKDELGYNKPKEYDFYQETIDSKMRIVIENLNLEIIDGDSTVEDEDYPIINEMEHNCRSISEVKKPFSVNKHGVTKFVVQTKFYEQKLKTTRCASRDEFDVSAGESCLVGLTGNKQATCQTQESSTHLYVYDKNTDDIEFVSVSFPSCCVCLITGS